MMTSTTLSRLRRALLIKVISRQAPSRSDFAAVLELTALKVMEALQAQSIRFYLTEGDQLSIHRAYFSPGLWADDPAKEPQFRSTVDELQARRLPRNAGVLGRVIESGEPEFERHGTGGTEAPSLQEMGGLAVHSALTVPLKSTSILGALQVLNKDPDAGSHGEFTTEDLAVLEEIAEYASTLIHRVADPRFQPPAEDAARFVARFTELPLVGAAGELEIDETLVESVGEAVIRRDGVFPFKRLANNAIAAVMTNPLDYSRREMFTRVTDLEIEEVRVVSATIFETLLKNHFKEGSSSASFEVQDINIGAVAEAITSVYGMDRNPDISAADLEREDSAPIIQLTNRVIEDAYISGASDIHIEPSEKDLLVRYRIDGLCQDKLRLPKAAAGAMVARLKIMCNLDISETRLPQDGRIIFKKYTKKNIDVDLRVAVGPVTHGEKVVIRLLDKSKSALPLGALGFSDENLARYRDCIHQPYGMILHCGPTGSGKSMTLYSALGEVNTRDTNIQTAEDPIEYTLPGLNQTQMNRQIGLTFARALRAYLRMDPDIILVGEIRDQETAQIAVEAALTGHLLVSTLHTNDAPSSVTRLSEMGVEPFNISASLVCVCAQRLMRRVCRTCRRVHEPKGREEEILRRAIGWSGPIFKANPNGCPACAGLGYKGRVGIHELMVNNEELTEGINQGANVADLKRIAIRNGMKTLHQDSLLKVKSGITTLEEALSTLPPDAVVSNRTVSTMASCA